MALGALACCLDAPVMTAVGELKRLQRLSETGRVVQGVELAERGGCLKDVQDLFGEQAVVEGKFLYVRLDEVGFGVHYFGDEVEHLFGQFAVEQIAELFVGGELL